MSRRILNKIRMIRLTRQQSRRRNQLSNRIAMARRGLTDVDGRVRVNSHKRIDIAQIKLRKLMNKIHGRR